MVTDSVLLMFLGHWLLMDAMGMGLCVAFIAFVRLPSLKVSTLLLSGDYFYQHYFKSLLNHPLIKINFVHSELNEKA